MTAPNTTIWDIEPRSLAKHEILRRYLQAWFPILASRNERLLYIDGFAGPGRYSKGEEGSPVIALGAARAQFARVASSELLFVFAEADAARAAHLNDVEIPALKLPPHFRTTVHQRSFEEVLQDSLDSLDAAGLARIPTFAFVDPFGIKGLPFTLLGRLLARPSSEVFVTFMGYTIQRFVEELPARVNELIGIPDAADQIAAAPDRIAAARRLYAASLGRTARFVHFFSMYSGNETSIYDLFFATNHPLGFLRMKEAMWAVDGSGAFSFSEGKDPTQLSMLSPTPGIDLAKVLRREFSGRRVLSSLVRQFVTEDTIYVPPHLTEALRSLEAQGTLHVDAVKQDGKRRKPGTFPPTSILTFAS